MGSNLDTRYRAISLNPESFNRLHNLLEYYKDYDMHSLHIISSRSGEKSFLEFDNCQDNLLDKLQGEGYILQKTQIEWRPIQNSIQSSENFNSFIHYRAVNLDYDAYLKLATLLFFHYHFDNYHIHFRTRVFQPSGMLEFTICSERESILINELFDLGHKIQKAEENWVNL
jgi:hypothetical protein